jgi:hypothetical protein
VARDLSYSETAALAKEHEEAELFREMQADVVLQVLRRLATIRSEPCRSRRPARRRAGRGLQARCTPVHGDEPLLAQEAATPSAPPRAPPASRAQGLHGQRRALRLERVLGAAQAMSLFADRQLIEIRIPSGKPGKDGSEALQRYCEQVVRRRADPGAAARLDWQQLKSAWFTRSTPPA